MSKQRPSPFVRSASEMVRRTICGVIDCSTDYCKLAADDVVIINLCDITQYDWTRIEFPHIPVRYMLASVELDDCTRFPIPFTLYYNDGEIDENLCYGVRCDVLSKSNEIIYTSERFVPVLTDNHPKTNVYILVAPRKLSTTTTKTTT